MARVRNTGIKLTEVPRIPRGLNGIGAWHWEKLCEFFIKKGSLEVGDLGVVELACKTYQYTRENGVKPKELQDLAKTYVLLMRELDATPKARQEAKANKKEDVVADELEEFTIK